MHQDFLKDMTESQFILVLLDEGHYLSKLQELISSVETAGTRICYLCLSKPYKDTVEELRSEGIDTGDFFFIDVLSSHYGPPTPAEDCKFISSPSDLDEIRSAIIDSVERRNCSAIVFDTISTLLIYQQTSSIVSFANNLISEKRQENTKKLFIILKDETTAVTDLDVLTKDLELFADKKIDMTSGKDFNSGG